MELRRLIGHLESKDDKTFIETFSLQALNDDGFLSGANQLASLLSVGDANQILNNPSAYDDPRNGSRYGHYNLLLTEISNTYTTYLFQQESDHAGLKESARQVKQQIDNAKRQLDKIEKSSKLVAGAENLNVYAEEFDTRAGKHGDQAGKWKKALYYSFAIFAVVFSSFLFLNFVEFDWLEYRLSEEIIHYGYLAVVIIKLVILIGILQAIRFFNKNYYAEKHLEKESLHKRDVLKALHGVYSTITDEQSVNVRNELVRTGAIIAFQSSESGYITRKEGAGGEDASSLSAIVDLFKK